MTTTETERVAVEVNECVVFAAGRGVGWWTAFRQTRAGIQTLVASIGGERVRVACDDEGHARWLARHMVAHGGLPARAVRVRKASAR